MVSDTALGTSSVVEHLLPKYLALSAVLQTCEANHKWPSYVLCVHVVCAADAANTTTCRLSAYLGAGSQ